MNRDKAVRLGALIVLCALVYYFSFEQGRSFKSPESSQLEQALRAKERIIETLSLEIRELKNQMAACEGSGANGPADSADENESGRLVVRLRSSRLLFENQLLVTCLEIDRQEKKAQIQINLIKEDKLRTETIHLGQGIKFSLAGQNYTLILEQIHSSFVTAQIIRI